MAIFKLDGNVVGSVPFSRIEEWADRHKEDVSNYVIELTEEEARELCAAHILRYYPEWKQLNVMRSRDSVAITTMSNFIDACRDWSNESFPDPEKLKTIVP